MKYTLKTLDDKRIEFVIQVEKKEWDEALENAYKENKAKYNIQGFRKGHAPRKVIEKTYGDTVFYDDAASSCFYRYYFEALSKEKGVEPVASPEVAINKIDDNGLELSVKVTPKPEVKLGKYKGLDIKAGKVSVSKDEIDHELEHLRESRVKFVSVDREIKTGDTATIDFSGSVDNVKFEGGSATDYDLEIGSKSFIDNFEEQLVGLKKGDKKNVEVKFPENYHVDNLKGKPAIFEVEIKDVKEKVFPELNDKFADEVSEFSTLEELRNDTERKLLDRKEKEERSKQENKLIDEIVDEATVEIPQIMVDEQVEDYIKDFEYRLSYQGLNLDGYLRYAGITLDELKKSRVDDARRTVKTRLVLEKIIVDEKLDITDKELLEKFNGIDSKNKVKSLEDVRKTMGEEQFNYFANSMLLNKLMNFLKENNNLEGKIEKEGKATSAKKTTTSASSKKATTSSGSKKTATGVKKTSTKKAESSKEDKVKKTTTTKKSSAKK